MHIWNSDKFAAYYYYNNTGSAAVLRVPVSDVNEHAASADLSLCYLKMHSHPEQMVILDAHTKQ